MWSVGRDSTHRHLVACLSVLIIYTATARGQTQFRPARPEVRQSRQLANCTNIAEVLDRCGAMSSYSHTMKSSQYPTTIDELKVACPRNNEGLNCLRSHIKCLKPMTKRAMLGFIDSRRRHVKSLCQDMNSNTTRNFLDAFTCIKKHKRQKFIQSEMTAIKRIEAILSDQVKDFKERFQRSCCTIGQYKQQTFDDLGQECSKPHIVAAMDSAIDSVVGEALEFACPDSKSKVCQSFKELDLPKGPVNKTLTRSGTDLLLVITAPDDDETPLKDILDNKPETSL